MSNQPQAHVADERAAFDKAIADATLTWRSDCPPEIIAWRAWQAARAAIPAGVDENELREHLARVFDAEPLERLSGYEVAGRIRAAMTCRIAAGAPAETPKPVNLIRACNAEFPIPDSPHASVVTRNEADREAFAKGWLANTRAMVTAQPAPAETNELLGYLNVKYGTFFRPAELAATERTRELIESGEIIEVRAAQPAPAPATDARELKAIDLGHGARLQRSTKTTGGVTWLMYNEHGLVRSLSVSEIQIVQATIAAMLSANSPREAG